jgi:hypothetical protein
MEVEYLRHGDGSVCPFTAINWREGRDIIFCSSISLFLYHILTATNNKSIAT